MPSDRPPTPTARELRAGEAPMTAMYVKVLVVQVFVLIALWTFQQYFSL